MNTVVFLHDGSFEGLLTAVARAIKSDQSVQAIYSRNSHNPKLFETVVEVTTDSEQAFRLFDYLKRVRGKALRFAIDGYFSEKPEIGWHLYQMVGECLTHGTKATEFYTNDSIRFLHAVSQQVQVEADRYTGLIRFRMLEDKLQYAPFAPNHMIIGYLAQHFKKRFNSRRWILHDLRRNFALYWDTTSLQTVEVDQEFTDHVCRYGEVPEHQLHHEERYYQDLWRRYHTRIAIANRSNPRLQARFMPQRYWKYLVETR